MVPAPLHGGLVELGRSARAGKSAFDPDRLEFRMLRAKGRPDSRLALRPARPERRRRSAKLFPRAIRAVALQSDPGRCKRAPGVGIGARIGGEWSRHADLLLTSTAQDHETVVGEARMALSCAERAGEFSMSIAHDWHRFGVGSALLEEIDRKAAADGIEW